MLATVATVVALVVPAHTPQEAVLRFIENRSPADACAQLAPAYKKALLAGTARASRLERVKTAWLIAGSKLLP